MIERKKDQNQKVPEIKTFPVPYTLGEIKEDITLSRHNPFEPTKKELIDKANGFSFFGEKGIDVKG